MITYQDKYYLKYLKYKKKYLKLKNQKGGVKFRVIPNNGGVTEILNNGNPLQMSNQCMWISIRDYLINVLHIPISVSELKTIAGLDLEATAHIQFDLESKDFNFKEGIERVARMFNLNIKCYLVDSEGNSHPALIDDRGQLIPMHIINEFGTNIVSIAFYGGHFELIVDGPGITQPIQNLPPNINVEIEKPKIFDKKTQIYIDPSSTYDKELMDLYINLIDSQQKIDINNKNIDANNKTIKEFNKLFEIHLKEIEQNNGTLEFFMKELERINIRIKKKEEDNREELKNLSESDLDEPTKSSIMESNIVELEKINKDQRKLLTFIDELKNLNEKYSNENNGLKKGIVELKNKISSIYDENEKISQSIQTFNLLISEREK